MKEQLKTISWCYEDLKNIIKLFKGNKTAINEQIDLTIYCLQQLKTEVNK